MSSNGTAPITPERIQQFAWGYVPPLVIEAAIRNRVFDTLDKGPATVAEVSAATGSSERGLTAIMNVLVGLNLLAKDAESRYSLTPESETFLVSTKPSFMGGLIRHTSEHLIPRWLHINKIVETGLPVSAVNQEESGSAFFHEFVTDIFPMSYPAAKALSDHVTAKTPAGSQFRVLDLAAGSGVWGIAQAQSSEQAHVTAVDWPGVLPITRKTVDRFGLSQRFSFVEGDLLEADFGTGYQLAILGHILHSEGEARSKALLAKTFGSLASGGTVAIAEFLVNADRTGPVAGLFFAVNMLVNTDVGNTFSFEEISAWLAEAGFVDARLLESPGPSPLILATKP
ncbi:methyltransferase [Acidicapsa dinghuensis]|uniref:Methyltransferase n=1 Tax=Acidicapsa dinghuensis TaxID=2218256 RepID=A0ABW1EDI4_9BACT|nr:acetylserotonin O-methyltransferase [Acidicapsa dinghuensis]